jgi:hypothetical protein
MRFGDLAQTRSRHPELNSAKYAPMKEASALTVEARINFSHANHAMTAVERTVAWIQGFKDAFPD